MKATNRSYKTEQYMNSIFGCVRSYANCTIGLPMPFGVQPFVTLAYHWYHWLSTGLTIGSIFCRRSRAWVKRFTRENYVIKMEDLKNLAAETSGITAIFSIQMTINNKVTNFWWQGSRWNIFQTASCYVILVFHFNPHCGDRIWTSKLVIGLNRDWAFREVSEH